MLVESDRLSSAIFWGPPGTGKTTLARVIARHTAKAYEPLSAVSASVKDVREIVAKASQRLGERGQGTILFLDEVHRFNKAQQDALLPSVESGLLVLVGATTENPYFEVNAPLLSRSTLFRLQPLDEAAIVRLLHKGLDAEEAEADDDALSHLADRAGGDGRHALTSLEVAVALARAREPDAVTPRVTEADAAAALGTKLQRYGRDEHYDVISAFIKSIRGSDPQAGLHYLARMLEAGEDARFIARRLVILASEDVGEADPTALVVATAAAHAVEYVGLPEAQLNLAQAVVHLATAPKSNRSALGIWKAREDVARASAARCRPTCGTPTTGRRPRSGTAWATTILTTTPGAGSASSTSPTTRRDAVYYQPSDHGYEQEIAERMDRRARPERMSERSGPNHELSALLGPKRPIAHRAIRRCADERHRSRRRDRRRRQRGGGRAAARSPWSPSSGP